MEGDRFTVFGSSYVALYDNTRWSAERDTIYQLPEGSRDFCLLREKQRYDMKKRQIIAN